jgi:hypothetical protein
MDSLAEQIIVSILQNEMALPVDTVWVRNQNRKIPNDDRLYAVVGMTDAYPQSSNTSVREDEFGQQIEVNQVQLCENIQIDVFSRSNDALMRHWEVMAALQSIYAQQQMEKNYFKISRLPRSFLNTSDAEGGSLLNRFTLSFACFVWYRKEKVLNSGDGQYYSDFGTRADDEISIGTDTGIFEFNIAAEG